MLRSGKLGASPQKMPSASLTMYRDMFVNQPHDVVLDYSDLISMMPERFQLSNFNDIFNSWKSSLDEKGGLAFLPELSSQSGIKTAIHYRHDFHDYKADCYIEKYDGNTLFCLKLANNGFLYPPVNQLTLYNSHISAQRHRNVFHKLDFVHKGDFVSLIAFAKAYLKCKKVRFQLFYCFEGDRMDFKAFNVNDGNQGVVITFERLVPLDGQFDNDYWLIDGDDEDVTETDDIC
jgi:hypothetical protein